MKNKQVQYTWSQVMMRPSHDNLYKLALEGYRKNSLASQCIITKAQTASEAILRVYRKTEDGKVEIPDHWLKRLFERPNHDVSEFELLEWTITFLDTGGASYWYLVRDPKSPNIILEAYPLRPDRMQIIQGNAGQIVGYRYYPENSADYIDYDLSEIFRIHYPDPLDPVRGLPPLARVAGEIGLDNEATDFTATFFKNGAVPLGVLSSENVVSDPEAERVQSRWQKLFRGLNRFKVAVLGKGLQYQQIGLDFSKMEFEALRAFTDTRICAAFGVPGVLVGAFTHLKEADTKASTEEHRRQLWERTLLPLLRRISSKINHELLQFEDDVFCEFDVSHIKALQEKEDEKWNRITTAWEKGLITRNMAFKELGREELPPEEGDVYVYEVMSPMMMMNPGEPGSPGKPSSGVNNGPESDDEDDPDRVERKTTEMEKKAAQEPEELNEEQEQYIQSLAKAQEETAGKIADRMAEFFQKQKQQAVEAAYINGRTVTEQDVEEIQQQIEEQQQSWSEELAAIALFLMMTGATAGGFLAAAFIGGRFDPNHPAVERMIQQYILLFVDEHMEKTRKDLDALLKQAAKEEWAATKLRDEIRALFNSYIRDRSKAIGDSESVRSINMGALMAYQQNGVERLRWVSRLLPNTCIFCQELHGKIVETGQPFLKLGESIEAVNEKGDTKTFTNNYTDVITPPLHPHCQCYLLPA